MLRSILAAIARFCFPESPDGFCTVEGCHHLARPRRDMCEDHLAEWQALTP